MIRNSLINKKIGKLTVLNYIPANENCRYTQYLCKCDCGNEVSIIRVLLSKGYSKSCGCDKEKLYEDEFRKRLYESIIKDENGCWNITKQIRPDGYGRSCYKGKYMGSHKASYIINYGEIKNKLCVLHKCDNRKCINPDHLYLGTYSDNAKDMIERKRQNLLLGINHQNHKYSEEKILKIREDFIKLNSITKVSKLHDIPYTTALKIIRRKAWKHI